MVCTNHAVNMPISTDVWVFKARGMTACYISTERIYASIFQASTMIQFFQLWQWGFFQSLGTRGNSNDSYLPRSSGFISSGSPSAIRASETNDEPLSLKLTHGRR